MAVDWEKTARVALAALGAIAKAIDTFKDRADNARFSQAADILTVIQAILGSVGSGKLDDLDPDQALRELDKLKNALSDNDAAADEALRRKFEGTDKEN